MWASGYGQEGRTTDGFQYIVENNAITITGWIGKDAVVVIPDEINGMPVVEIGRTAFYKNKRLKKVVLSKNLTNIELTAFERSGVNTFVVPDFVRYVSLHPPLSAWYVLYGRRAGVYTCKKNVWYLEGTPLPDYAILHATREFSVDGSRTRNESGGRIGNSKFILSPGTHSISYRNDLIKSSYGDSPSFNTSFIFEAGKVYNVGANIKYGNNVYGGRTVNDVEINVIENENKKFR